MTSTMTLVEQLWQSYRYSNAPEGKKPLEKMIGLTKYGFLAGFGQGAYNCIFHLKTFTFWNSVNVVSYYMLPYTAMCATFASVAYTTTKLRGKDDYASYIAASLATTAVFHHLRKNGISAFTFGIGLTIAAMVKKYSDLDDWSLTPLHFSNLTKYRGVPIDWTFIKDPRGPRPWE